MSETPILISNLNDFIFCPVSIYFHALDEDTDQILLQDTAQLNGAAAHEKSDLAAYSTRANMLQGRTVYSERLNLIGKIDTFDTKSGILTERKKRIKTVYDGYSNLFLSSILKHKNAIFWYIQAYYRSFMKELSANDFPIFYLEKGQEET